MSNRLVTDGIWSLLTKAAKANAGRAHVAVAYFAKGASRLLPLTEGSRLVVDLSERAVRSGQTCPADILKLIRAGVEVFSVPNLHAKVFVFPKEALIGSVNASQSSAHTLVEAAVVTEDRRLIAGMRRFVDRLARNRVTLNEAKLLRRLYRPPQFPHVGGRRRTRPKGEQQWASHATADMPSLRIVQLKVLPWSREANQADKPGLKSARKKVRDTRHYTIDRFLITGRCRFRERESVVQVTDVGRGRRLVSPQGKVVHLQPVPLRRGKETIVYVESAKKLRRKGLNLVLRRLPKDLRRQAKALLGKHIVLHDGALIEEFLGLWGPTNLLKQ